MTKNSNLKKGVVDLNTKQQKTLVVMYGGPGGEHEVSVKSGENVFQALDKSKYGVKKVKLPKNFVKIRQADLERWRREKVLVLPIMHGRFGEGGVVQKILEKNKIKFIGCGSKVAALCMDKVATQKVLEKHKILVPKSWVVKSLKDLGKVDSVNFIVKQLDGGSSVDLYKAKDISELEIAVKKMLKKYKQCLVQEFIEGREFTCGVIQKRSEIIALPVTEIVLTKTELFDYNAKYSVGGCSEITPAEIDDKLRQRIQSVTKKVFKVVGCKDLGRVDMILGKDNRLYVLEINTMPGMTGTSLIPQQLAVKNMTTTEFLDIIISNNEGVL